MTTSCRQAVCASPAAGSSTSRTSTGQPSATSWWSASRTASVGRGRVVELGEDALEMEVVLDAAPPEPANVTLVLAVPRPKVLNRVIASAASMGIKRIVLMNAWRVEKSYWSSPRMQPANLDAQAILGLEQAKDTVLPVIEIRRFFRRFVEDELPALARGTRALVAHPRAKDPCPRAVAEAITLAVGPEGGFIEAEIASLGGRWVHTVFLSGIASCVSKRSSRRCSAGCGEIRGDGVRFTAPNAGSFARRSRRRATSLASHSIDQPRPDRRLERQGSAGGWLDSDAIGRFLGEVAPPEIAQPVLAALPSLTDSMTLGVDLRLLRLSAEECLLVITRRPASDPRPAGDSLFTSIVEHMQVGIVVWQLENEDDEVNDLILVAANSAADRISRIPVASRTRPAAADVGRRRI